MPANFKVLNQSSDLEKIIKYIVITVVLLFVFQGTIITFILLFYIIFLFLKLVLISQSKIYPAQYINEVKALQRRKDKLLEGFRKDYFAKIIDFESVATSPLRYDFISKLSPLDRFFLYQSFQLLGDRNYILGYQTYVFNSLAYQYRQSPKYLASMAFNVIPKNDRLIRKRENTSKTKLQTLADSSSDFWVIQDSSDSFWLFPRTGWEPSSLFVILSGKFFHFRGIKSNKINLLKPALLFEISDNEWGLQEMGEIEFTERSS